MTGKHYLLVVSPGPPMIFRVPWPMPPWRSGVLRAATAVMRAHGLRQKDIHSLEGLVPYPADREGKDLDLVKRADEAFEGGTDRLSGFWLYDWQRGAFKLARAAVEI